MITWIIDGAPRTKKNSMVRTRYGLIQGKTYREYEKAALWQLQGQKAKKHFGPEDRIETGARLQVRYWLQNRKGFPDLLGLLQATADILEKAGIIENDSFFVDFDGSLIAGIDPDWPRAEINIYEVDNLHHPCYSVNPKLNKRVREKKVTK